MAKEVTFNPFTGKLQFIQGAGAGSGDVVGPGSSTDNAVVRFNGTTGLLIQDSGVLVSDTDDITAVASITLDAGATIDEFSIDGTLAGNSDTALPTEQAVKTYVDTGTVAKGGWNGSIVETTSVSASSDGVTITFSVEQDGGGDLQVIFSDGIYDWDTTPADTVSLTAGSDTSPTLNYVYFLQSTKTLTASTAGWPATEHAPLATVLCQSAASFQTDGAYKFHAWTDHVTSSNNQGHVGHLNFWIRQQAATWVSGVAQTYTITTNGGAADNVILTTAAGVALQLHDHTFPAFAGTPDVYVVNDSVTPYDKVTDLNALLTDSTGASMSGRYFSLVIWGCVSEDTGDCKLFCNLPSGSYNNQTGVEEDLESYSNYTIPANFTGTGFLISEWKLRHQAAASGTWTSIEEIDLRGLLPAVAAGGSAGSGSEFVDNAFQIVDDGDNTKVLAFQCSGITTSTTRTLTVPDASGTIALTSDLVMPSINVGKTAAAHQVNTTTAFPPIKYRDFTNIEINVRGFDDTGPEYMQSFFRVPDDLGAGASNVTFEIVGSAATAAASKNVKFTFDFVEVADGGLMTGAYADAEVWDDQSISATQDDQDIISNTETITNLGWTAGNMIYYRLYRSAATTNNLSGDYDVISFNILIPQA